MIPRWAVIVFLIVSVLGFLDATYLTVEHYRGVIPPCSLVEGCETVLASEYAAVWGIPVALLGAVYYLFMSILALLYLDRGNVKALIGAAWGTILGLLASSWFLFVQFAILRAVCLYCLLSAASSLLLFALGMWFLYRMRRTSHEAAVI